MADIPKSFVPDAVPSGVPKSFVPDAAPAKLAEPSTVDLTKPAFSTDKSGTYQPPIGALRPANPQRAAAGRELLSQEQQAYIPQGFLRSLGGDISSMMPLGSQPPSTDAQGRAISIPESMEREQAERFASGQPMSQRMAVGTGESLGVNIPGMEQAVGAGQMSDAWGHLFAVPALSVIGDYAQGKLLKSIRALPDQLQIGRMTFSPKDELHAAAVDRTGQAHLEAQKHLQTGMRTLEAMTDAKAQNIENADQINKVPLDARPVQDALLMKKVGPQGVSDSAIVKSAEGMIGRASMQPHPSMPNEFVDQGLDKMSFGSLKRLRTRLGGLFNKNMTPSERAVIGAAYDKATDLLAGRAGDLNLSKDWNGYNDEFKRQRVFKETTFNDLMQPSLDDPRAWFNKVDVTNNPMLRSWLDEMDAKTNPAGLPGQGAGSAFKKVVKDVKPFVKILNTPEGQNVMGRFKAFFQNPVAALIGAGLGSQLFGALSLPGGKWIGGMAGATQSVELANKLAIAHWLIKGEQFPMGAELMRSTPGLGMATPHTGPSPITVQPNEPAEGPVAKPSPKPGSTMGGINQAGYEASTKPVLGRDAAEALQAENNDLKERLRNKRYANTAEEAALRRRVQENDTAIRQFNSREYRASKIRDIKEKPSEARARVLKQIREGKSQEAPNPTPERRALVGRGAHGQVTVEFPDSFHKELFSQVGRSHREMTGRSGIPSNIQMVANKLGISTQEAWKAAESYRAEIMKAIKDKEEGTTYVAPRISEKP